ncbi:MAG: hypothetical protein P8X70_00080, partial [Nanoarchaeota archaeon]
RIPEKEFLKLGVEYEDFAHARHFVHVALLHMAENIYISARQRTDYERKIVSGEANDVVKILREKSRQNLQNKHNPFTEAGSANISESKYHTIRNNLLSPQFSLF